MVGAYIHFLVGRSLAMGIIKWSLEAVMKFRYLVLCICVLAALVGCSSYQLKPDQITVKVSPEIMADEKKGYAVERYRADAYLEQYLREFAEAYQPRNTMQVEAVITSVYLGWGRDRMEVEATVRENGKVLERFSFSRTTGKGKAVKRLTSALAKDIMSSMRDL